MDMGLNRDCLDAGHAVGLKPGAPEEFDCAPIAPILAGARARGMADAFEMLEIAAVLVAADGEVLFANARARALLGRDLTLSGEHLRAIDEADERALRCMIDAAVAESDAKPGALILRRGAPSLRLRAMPVVSDRGDPFQLARAVIVLDRWAGRPAR
jgi:hypothetical protein